jgi:hypothetical protein
MESSKNKILFIILILCMISGLSVKAQSISYSYVDPCTKENKSINVSGLNGSLPIVMNYYGQVRTFTPIELQNGTFDNWANSVYNEYGKGNPCDQIGIQTITTNVLNVTNNVVNNVVSLGSMLTSITSSGVNSIPTDVVSKTGTGSNTTTPTDNPNGGSSGSNGGGNSGGSSGSNGGGNSSGSSGSNGGGNSGSTVSNGSSEKKEEKKEEEKKEEEVKEEENKQASNSTKSTSKATSKSDKPAILLTGDLVGMQSAADSKQDAKATMSYIRISGNKKTSLGVSADFTINANIGNITVFRSWMTQKTARKHIDLVSNSVSLLPNSFSNTLVFIRIDNVKKFTGLYGAGYMYGTLNKETLTSLLTLGGGMYRGQLTKKVDAVFILVAVYVPYMKYYTENIFQSKPLILPFMNINYKLTKSFRFGLTAGTTYSVNEQLINYQVLFGAKLTL